MKRLGLCAAIAAAIFVSACSSTGSGVTIGGQNSVVGDIVQFGKQDLDAAYATAKANPNIQLNRLAVRCIPTFENWVGTFPLVNGSIQISGLFSGLEAGIVLVNGVQAPVPDAVYNDCGGLFLKGRVDILRLLGGVALPLGIKG